MAQAAKGATNCIDAGSDAEATTTIEYSMALLSVSVFTNCATVDRFCPIAQ
jgi:hypothetical protein